MEREMSRVDADSNGCIDFREFVALMCGRFEGTEWLTGAMRAAFAMGSTGRHRRVSSASSASSASDDETRRGGASEDESERAMDPVAWRLCERLLYRPYECPGYGTATFELKSEKAAGDREPVQAAERSIVERTASRKQEPTEEQKDARAAARRAKKARQKANKAERKAAAAAASEAERADYPHAQLRENVEFVMEGLEAAAQAARNPSGSNIQVAYSLPPEGGSGFGDLVYATVPLGSVATKVARDWLANELYEPSRSGKIDAACRDRKVADLITAAGASAPADAVFGGRFATGEAPRPTTPASEADEGDGVGGDGGTGIEHFDLFEPDPTPMEDL
ncbi:hypothetical protein EMIHUDRAFT_116258 [Emiliania huxleyi CCMP1516]|uniref:EF-hand domain-containing protein n=2 Tax=Emiliania huxleyi TaxID=2903 RepID=A0A0D3JJK0_EMIH1|nr:hypothetical protein EMIHUDRAFT_116258 [Emiliania huxleyi CCMP1516]EOD23685.1 hypothetical protein EMIHUDRAFT_116258 [Emiliania huxleyi CCMP1516]|eukprot:XP_005776114.1 hypothetical protein EMIHUDRAFT_116258 [Emiliania huxleyi CCMP1516]